MERSESGTGLSSRLALALDYTNGSALNADPLAPSGLQGPYFGRRFTSRTAPGAALVVSAA